MSSESAIPLDSFVTFGDLLKYLRHRARLTQREVAIAVGYSEAQISRLEQNQRPPDMATLTALFVPALFLEDEPLVVNRLMELAALARGESSRREGSSPSPVRSAKRSKNRFGSKKRRAPTSPFN
jgi:DNA-binding XRE family transcriptional regulator